MKKKSLSFFMCFFFIFILLSSIAPAGDEQQPEIIDNTGDINLSFLDIGSVWFYEKADESDYLFISMKIKDLNEGLNAVFSVRWTYNDVVYVSGLDTFYFKDRVFKSGLRQRATYWQWKNMPECIGFFDDITNIITWKILKSDIGNPKKDDFLKNTEASAVMRFPSNIIYIFNRRDYRDFAPNTYGDYGENYIIQY